MNSPGVEQLKQRTTFGPDKTDGEDCNSENLSDLGSDRCPFEQKDPSESEEVKEANQVLTRKSLLQNIQDEPQIARASKGSFSSPDFCEPGSTIQIVHDNVDGD